MGTKTVSFGTTKRESHDSTQFYSRSLFSADLLSVFKEFEFTPPQRSIPYAPPEKWVNKIYCHTAEDMFHIPNNSIALVFTSPPYNVGKDYDKDLSLRDYLLFISRVGAEVYRVLKEGGRYVINIANLGRKPYIPLHAYFYLVHLNLGFSSAGEIIWRKGKGLSGSCAWGSWCSAKAPRIRDIHEYLLIFVKGSFERKEKGKSTITPQEFVEYTLSVWDIPPEQARKVKHPAPFPLELAKRVIKLFSYEGDIVLDPFAGSGTTLLAAKQLNRFYVGYEIEPEYCNLILERLTKDNQQPSP